jgi:hypothetical protein
MNEVKEEHYFYLKNGETLRSLENLKTELEKNSEKINLDNFYHHVTPEGNDYANWIEYVLEKKELSNKIRQLKNPQEMLNEILSEEKENEKLENKDLNNIRSQTEIQPLITKEKKREKVKKILKKVFKLEKNTKEKQENLNQDSEEPRNKEQELKESDFFKEPKEQQEKKQEKTETEQQEKTEIEQQTKQETTKEKETITKRELDADKLAESSEKMLEKTKTLKKNSYIDTEKQKETVSQLREKYEELYTTISEHRRQGKDMFMPYMHLRLIKPKLHFLEISNKTEERIHINALLKEVEKEIQEATTTKQLNLKEEILEKAGLLIKKIEE